MMISTPPSVSLPPPKVRGPPASLLGAWTYGDSTIFVPSSAAISAVHEAFNKILFVDVNAFFVPSALCRRWNAIF
jgi:hypothetical protein